MSMNRVGRRDVLHSGISGSLGLPASGGGDARGRDSGASDVLKGNLKQSVSCWTYEMLSLDELCEVVNRLGFSAIDLVGPQEWPTLKAHGVHASLCWGPVMKGFSEAQHHDELVARYTEYIDLMADAGYRNLLCFSGNRNERLGPLEGLANAELALKRVVG